MPRKLSIILLASVLIVVNIVAINQGSLDIVRLLRSLSSFLFIVLYVVFGGAKRGHLFSALLLFFISDLLIIKYDNLFYNNLTSVVNSLGYVCLGLYIWPKFKIELRNKKVLILYMLIIALSAYMFYQLILLMAPSFQGFLHKYLYFGYSLILLGLLILVGNYNFRYNSIQSTSCMYFVFSFVVSDLFAFIAYYLSMPLFYYPTRLFYIIGLAVLVSYAVLPFEKEELFDDNSQSKD